MKDILQKTIKRLHKFLDCLVWALANVGGPTGAPIFLICCTLLVGCASTPKLGPRLMDIEGKTYVIYACPYCHRNPGYMSITWKGYSSYQLEDKCGQIATFKGNSWGAVTVSWNTLTIAHRDGLERIRKGWK